MRHTDGQRQKATFNAPPYTHTATSGVSNLDNMLASLENKKAQLSLSNPRDAKVCEITRNCDKI